MSGQSSRVERYVSDRFSDFSGVEEAHKQHVRETAADFVESENQEFWALYRALDVSQNGVRELVGPFVETSQSTVSRVIREKDDAVITDEDALDVGGTLHEDELGEHADEWLEAYRETLANAKADLLALRAINSPTEETPEWAAERFPELVGCHNVFARHFPEDEEIADDSHLNRIESVNTDRWE